MKVINTVFICGSLTTRQDLFVTFGNSHGIFDQRKLSGFTKLGRFSGKTLRGWLRHGMEKLLLQNGITVCHPLPANTITNTRNKDYYKKDLALGYHGRGECQKDGGCPIYHIFGDLDYPSNIIVPSIYFYPSSGGGTMATNFQKIFGLIGKGRIEIDHESPRKRSDSHQTYMSLETIVGTFIEAPWNIVIRDGNELHQILILKTLEFLFEKNKKFDMDFMVGGQRTAGCGNAIAVKVSDNGNYLVKNRNSIGVASEEAELISQKFKNFVDELKKKFPINNKKENRNNAKNKK